MIPQARKDDDAKKKVVGELLRLLEERRISDHSLAEKVWDLLVIMKNYICGLEDDLIERWQREENALQEIFTSEAALAYLVTSLLQQE